MDNLEVRVHSEISSYSEKFYGLTVRQWIAVVLSLLCDVPLFIMLKDFVNSDLLQILIVIITAPILAIGFIKVQELPFEEFFVFFKRTYLNLYKPLKFQSDKDYKLEKEYYRSLSFFKKVKYLINKDKTNDIPIQDRIKMEGKEKSLSKKEIKKLKELEKRKIKAQQKVEKKRKKEEKELKKMYQKKYAEEKEEAAKKTLEETKTYAFDTTEFDKDFADSENNDLKENFYYLDDDSSEEAVMQSKLNQKIENENETLDKKSVRSEPTEISKKIENKEKEIKNLKKQKEFEEAELDISAIMNSFLNK